MIYRRIAFIGLGLIASSMALAIRRGHLATDLIGYSRTDKTAREALELGIIDEICESPEEAVRDADLVVLCTPVGAFGALAERIAPALKVGATLSDVGSVKQAVIAAVTPHLPKGIDFVPAHPIAGTEQSGPSAGFAELFDDRHCVLTPLPTTDAKAVARLSELWSKMGSRVDIMDPAHHDLVLAVTSHLPHLIAYTMVGVADHLGRITNSEVIQYSAAGFRDFTRIAASDPVMWRDVFLNNKSATLDILGRFTEELFALQRAIRTNQGNVLEEYFTRTRSIREGIVESGQDTADPNFGRDTR